MSLPALHIGELTARIPIIQVIKKEKRYVFTGIAYR